MTLPVWISAAAAFVTAAVTRLVAPVWSLGPHGEAGTSFLQSVWANAADPSERKNSKTPAATSAVRAMIETPSAVKGTSRASMRGGSYAYAAAWSSPPGAAMRQTDRLTARERLRTLTAHAVAASSRDAARGARDADRRRHAARDRGSRGGRLLQRRLSGPERRPHHRARSTAGAERHPALGARQHRLRSARRRRARRRRRAGRAARSALRLTNRSRQ